MASEERDFITRRRLCHEKRLCPMKEAKSGEKKLCKGKDCAARKSLCHEKETMSRK